jgi:outer membrane murein-binding lipoprotein Lpp
MDLRARVQKLTLVALAASSLFLAGRASAADIKGQVMGGGAPITQCTVILMQASAGEPKQLAQTKTDSSGNFSVHGAGAPGSSLYLVASGGVPAANKAAGNNPAILLLAVVGGKPPAKVVINEMTTIASVVTHAQFIVGTWIKGSPIAIGIAAGNVPNFVDLSTGGYGPIIVDALNSGQTPTMANFATLSSILAGCITQVKADACSRLYAAASPPNGGPPVDTLSSVESIEYTPWHQPDKIFALLDYFYPVPQGKTMRPTPFMPYLSYAPSAWIFPLKFTGGGLSGPGKLMIDSEGNALGR